ncbi:hypothetical protein KUCAC02_004347 [Chaenocephalus aceratus]|uniref:Uncharacterized protein n=1 Tax=Chaenocephalus aceratus TaxID=36190 RepID=A0ACB9WYA4_CHAAC|nr:hypothetical protein KUCAC02_004347 [Chaenocephalus aceratus]
MNVKILTLVIVLLVSLLCSASAGPMASTEHGRGLQQAATTSRLEEETPTATSFPQGAHAVLEQGTALSALPQVLISMLFLCLGGPCNEGPTLAQPEE